MASQKRGPKIHLKTILSQKTVHKRIVTTLQRLKIDPKCLKTRLESSYRVLKISKTTTFSPAGLLACRSDRRTGPILSIIKALAVCNIDLLFEEDLSTVT